MADKDLTIRIKSVGADAAAKEIDKIPQAIEEIPKSAPSIDKIPDAIADITQTAPKAVDAIEKIPAAIDEISNTAPKAVDSIFAIEDAAKNAARELDVMAAKQRLAEKGSGGKTPGILDTDVSAAAGAAGQKVAEMAGFGAQFRAVSKAISADAVAVGASVAIVGKVAMESYQLVTSTVERYKQLMVEAKAAGQAIRPELEQEVLALEALMGPLKSAVDAVGGAWEKTKKVFSDPVGELSGLNDLKDSINEATNAQERLRLKIAEKANAAVDGMASIYRRENQELLKQEESIQRIARLRAELGSIEQQRANNQIRIAQQDGGDVALAEANALAVELRAKQQELTENLRQAQAGVSKLQDDFRAADVAYRTALQQNLEKADPAKFKELSDAWDQANEALDKGKEMLPLIEQKFAAAQTAAAEDIEIKLVDLKDKYGATVTKEADAAFKSITDTLRTSITEGPTAAIAQIEVAAGAVTTAATEKAGQVKAAIDGERSGTVTAIQGLAPSPQDSQSIVSAIQSVAKAIEQKDQATINAFKIMEQGISQMANRFQQQQAQINQLFQRLR